MADADKFADRQPTFQTANNIYLLPNDQPEHERLISQHRAFAALSGGKLLQIPEDRMQPPRKIVDVGCGTGIVTRELADAFPDAEVVYGLDLTVVGVVSQQTDDARKNLKFVEGDIMTLAGEGGKGFEWDSFDLVYSRLLICGMTDWPGYVDRAFRLLRPGGWVQVADFCEDVYFDPAVTTTRPPGFVANREWPWLRNLREGGRRKGLDMDAGKNVPALMRARGFVEVETTELVIPYWRRSRETMPDADACFKHHVNDPWALWWHMIPRMVEGMGLSPELIRQWQQDSKKDLGEEPGKYQALYITVGRRPDIPKA